MSKNRKVTESELSQIIEYLQGTTNTLDEAVDRITDGECDESDLETEQFAEIDDHIFLCVECGWWCEISQVSSADEDENFCQDCKPEDDE